MNSFYVLLGAILLYIFSGKLVDLFAASGTSGRLHIIKTKIIFHSFLAPIMFSIVLFFVISSDSPALDIVFACGIVLASIIRIFSARGMYLTKFEIEGNFVDIEYLTRFLKIESRRFNLLDITSMEVASPNWLVGYPASVNVRHMNQWITFEIMDNKLKTEVERKIASAPLGVVNGTA